MWYMILTVSVLTLVGVMWVAFWIWLVTGTFIFNLPHIFHKWKIVKVEPFEGEAKNYYAGIEIGTTDTWGTDCYYKCTVCGKTKVDHMGFQRWTEEEMEGKDD